MRSARASCTERRQTIESADESEPRRAAWTHVDASGRPDLAIVDLQKDVEDLRRTLPASGALALRELLLAEAQLASGQPRRGPTDARSRTGGARRAFADGEPTPLVDTTFAILEARVRAASGDALGALALLDMDRPAIRMDRLRLLVERARLMLALQRPAEALSHAQSVVAELALLPLGNRPVQLEASPVAGRSATSNRNRQGWSGQPRRVLVPSRREHDVAGSIWLAQVEQAIGGAALERPGARRASLPDQRRR